MKKKIMFVVMSLMLLFSGAVAAQPTAKNVGKPSTNTQVKPPASTKPTNALDKKRQKIVDTAVSLMKKKQVKYVHWKDRQEKVPVYKTDCSGYTYLVYRLANVGVKLINRDDDDQAADGKLVTNNFKKGDLLFYWTDPKNKGNIAHVGIYIGDNKIIHNAGIGKDVIISDITTKWYKDRFVVGRRKIY